jgi:hypothetical protein
MVLPPGTLQIQTSYPFSLLPCHRNFFLRRTKSPPNPTNFSSQHLKSAPCIALETSPNILIDLLLIFFGYKKIEPYLHRKYIYRVHPLQTSSPVVAWSSIRFN